MTAAPLHSVPTGSAPALPRKITSGAGSPRVGTFCSNDAEIRIGGTAPAARLREGAGQLSRYPAVASRQARKPGRKPRSGRRHVIAVLSIRQRKPDRGKEKLIFAKGERCRCAVEWRFRTHSGPQRPLKPGYRIMYLSKMTTASALTTRLYLCAGSAIAAAVLAFAFWGWIQNGSAIFLTLAETGMSWCF